MAETVGVAPQELSKGQEAEVRELGGGNRNDFYNQAKIC